MLLSLLLAATLAVQSLPPGGSTPATPIQVPAEQTAPTLAAAGAMIDEGELEAALRAFRVIAAANPEDHAARLRIAELHARMGDHYRAESVYRSLWLEDPDSAQAALGVASALSARREFADAIDVLETAEKRAPQNAELLAALGRAHEELGHSGRSIPYLQRAASLAPNQKNLSRLKRTRKVYDHRIDLAGLNEQFDGPTPASRGADLQVQVRLSEALRVSGRGQWQRKLGVEEARGGAGLEWRWARSTFLIGHGLYGRGNRVLPETEGYAALEHRLSTATGRLGVRYLDFGGTRVIAVEPSIIWWLTNRSSVELRYAFTSTDFPRLFSNDESHHGRVLGTQSLFRGFSMLAGYARGIEDFDAISIDRVGAFRANTALAGLRLDLPTQTALIGEYEYQWREGAGDMQRVTVTLTHRF